MALITDMEFLVAIGKAFTPKKLRPTLRAYVAKAGYPEVPYGLFGVLFFVLLAIFYAIYVVFVLPAFKGSSVAVSFIYYFFSAAGILLLLAALLMLIIHFFLDFKIYGRTKELERLLPDYLTLVSTNLKGGMSFERALWDAIKPEFGVLAAEIGLVSKRVMTGNDVAEALQEFVEKYDSPILRRNFQLIISEFESGGKIVTVIDKIIENLKKTQILKKELAASTVTYMMFIGTLVIAICPLLFALSFQLFTLITGFMGSIAGGLSSGAGPMKIVAPNIKASDFKTFSTLAVCIIGAGSSCIISIIEKGNMRSAVRYIPIFITVSLALYFIALSALSGVFASISGLT